MNETNTTPTSVPATLNTQAPTQKVKKKPRKATAADKAARAAFPTAEVARAAKPDNAKFSVFRVTGPEGQVFFTWADGHWSATVNVVKALGWRASTLDKQPPTKEELAALLAQLSPEDRAALLGQLGGAPAAEKGKKGK